MPTAMFAYEEGRNEPGGPGSDGPSPAGGPQKLSATLSRRSFVTGSLALAVPLATRPARADATAGGLKEVRGGDATPSLFIGLQPDGAVRLTCHRSEMGQQVWTSLAQILADELDADWSRVVIVQATGHPRYGDQNTDGSRSVRRNFHRLRVAGAAMRAMLLDAAAKRWGVPRAQLTTSPHRVEHAPSKRAIGYGELAADAAKLAVPAEKTLKLKDRAGWRYIGKPMPSLTGPQIVKGAGTFGWDVQRDGMLVAVIARPPQLGATVASVDDAAAKAVAGVVAIETLPHPQGAPGFHPLGGVAVLARNTWAALEGRRKLKITWKDGPHAGYDSASFKAALLATVNKPGEVRRQRGDVTSALKTAKRRVAASYYVPHLSQSPMEPPAATAAWSNDGQRVEIWACTQTPQASRKEVARACGVKADSVTVHPTWLGGAFGRKSKPDFVVEAALLAKRADKPVKVVWSREDDLQHGYVHTVSAQRLEAGLDHDGTCVAMLHRTAFPPISSTFSAGARTPSWGELRLGASDNPFDVPNLQLESGDAEAHLRIGWLRSVANVYHAFALQSFAAELAHAAGADPLDYLLKLIGKPRTIDPNREGAKYDNYGDPLDRYPIATGRLAHVAKKAADMADWKSARPAGTGLGIAAHRSFLTYVAAVVEVVVDEQGRLTIPHIWAAMDAGTVVNPRHAAAQVEGGIIYGLSNAMYGAITATGGVVEQDNFPAWRVMRMNEAPRAIDVHIVERDAPPGGVGEPATPVAAPALCNAIFAATSVRIRELPVFGGDRRDRIERKT